ncbi:MAG TPA: glutamate--tRNA ligase [Bdellovibrionota bacterium]|nr:glutamate--tRNA ligase [Bdellovibrionota bacterium]
MVRVRFAPSPTGHLHVGGARTALFNWLFTRHHKGTFVLRVEDTDTARSTKESELAVLEDLQWLGLNWDEGPDNGGPFGPYRQSERTHLYKKYSDGLIAKGQAYRCYCTDEELTLRRDEAFSRGEVPQYPGTCRNLTKEQQQSLLAEGRKPAVRFIVPKGSHHLDDIIRGPIEFPEGMVGDFIIYKQDGLPTYNFAVVVDDALMEITHVLRAEEHLSNTNRQLMLFHALGFQIPKFGHFSLVMGRDEGGKVSKLSKRHGATSVAQFKEDGFLSHALVNYLAMLGWSHPEGKEKLTQEELINSFSIERVGKSPSIFDIQKLQWLNGLYIRELSPEAQAKEAIPYLNAAGVPLGEFTEQRLVQAIHNLSSSISQFSEIAEKFSNIYISEKFSLDPDAKVLLQQEDAHQVVKALKGEFEASVEEISSERFKEIMKNLQTKTGLKGKALFHPVRAAITGKLSGPELDQVVMNLGKAACLKRLDLALKDL